MKAKTLLQIVSLGLLGAVVNMTPASAQTVLIGFETDEGFPAQDWMPDNNFSGMGLPSGIVSSWIVDSGSLWHDAATGGYPYEGFAAQSGTRYAAKAFDAATGINVGTMDLVDSANLSLTSFYWAWRGSGTTLPGGDSFFTAEYFGLDGQSLGTETFYGGMAVVGGAPEWTLATVSLPGAVGAPLSKVVFTGNSPVGSELGWYYLDTITLTTVPEPSVVGTVAVGASLIGLTFLGRMRRRNA